MLIYVVWESINFICSQIKLNRKRVIIFLSCILWLILGLRSVELGLYDTKTVYYDLFNNVARIEFKDLISQLSFIKEPLMKIITWIVSHITDNFQIYLLVTSLFPIISIAGLLLGENKDPVFGLAIYFGLFFFYNTFLIKQMLALSVIIFSYKYLKNRKFIKFAIGVTTATLIHKTSIFFILAYPLCNYVKFTKKFIIFMAVLIGIGILAPSIILNLIFKLPFYNFEIYIQYGIYQLGKDVNFSMFFYIILLIFCYYLKKNNKEKDYNDLLILSFIGCVLNSWSTIVTEFYRIALYFNVFYCVLLPYAVNMINIRNRKIIRLLLLLIMYMYAFKIALNTHSLVYKVFW